jgi:mannose-1-phosphate guanylyltransferase
MRHSWAVVLAGGDGARLRAMTTTREGQVIPKQYCSLGRSECLIQDAVKRAQGVVSSAHVCTVVAAQHRHWWRSALLSRVADRHVFIQPQNKGTGYGILFALLKLRRIDPDAVVTLLPADHYFRDEVPIVRSMRTAMNLAHQDPQGIYFLGTEPEGPDSELGYILPAERVKEGAVNVTGFCEKPDRRYALELIALGALWNLFILAGGIRALLELFEESYARVTSQMAKALEQEAGGNPRMLEELYQGAVPVDFSKDVLELHSTRLNVVQVPNCGWTDLGTPQRVAATVRNLTASKGFARPVKSQDPLFFDLSAAG